ncbi:MAG: MBL fold metallo-hydrolase [Clostridia bacterium]|nr:MBL fold metallo-hydrolase [Clostridia bacterium]
MIKSDMSKKSLSLYSLKYAESVLSESMTLYGGAKEIVTPISFAVYLIKTKDKNILVDAGCDTMPDFVMKGFYSPAFVLRQVGLSADEITDVIITHSHHDHIEALNHFKNALVHISEEEYLNGRKYIPDNMRVNIFKETSVIDNQIEVIKWGGHSVGSAIVEIKDNNITHILAGDECYINDCIVRRISTGAYYDLEKSRVFVEKYSDKKYRVHTCHDISLKTEKII